MMYGPDHKLFELAPYGAALVFIAFIFIKIAGPARARGGWLLAATASSLFAIWSGYAVFAGGWAGFWPLHQAGVWGNQIWFDLLLAVGVVDEWTVVLGEDGLREPGEQPVDLLGLGEQREQVDRAVTVVPSPFLRDPDGLASRGSRAQHGARDTGVVGEDRRECGVPAEGEQPQRAAHLHLDVVVAGGGQGADELGHVSIVGGGEGAGQVPDAILTRSCRRDGSGSSSVGRRLDG